MEVRKKVLAEIRKTEFKRVQGQGLYLLYCLPETCGRFSGTGNSAIVFLHGGGLTGGRAEDYIPHCRYFAEKGMIGISVEYRLLSKDTSLETCLDDAADAVAYIRLHWEEFGINPHRIIVVGESAGAYLALALATFWRKEEADCFRPDLVVNCNGVADLTGGFIYFVSPDPIERPIKTNAEMRSKAKFLSPLYNIIGKLPPLLNLQGKQDRTVLPQAAEAFHRAYLQAGGHSEIVIWEDAGHAFLVPGYTAAEAQYNRALEEIERVVRIFGRKDMGKEI